MSRLDHEEVLKTQSAAAANMTAGRYKLVFGGAVAALVIIGIVVAVTAQSGADGGSVAQKERQPSGVPASSSGRGSRTVEPRRDSIRDVDFNNFTYGEIRLVNGRYQSEEAVCSLGSDDGGSIEFTDVNGDGLLDALVALGCFSPGGNSSWGMFFLYIWQPGGVISVSLPDCQGASLNGALLTCGDMVWEEEDPRCCPSKQKITTYKFDGGSGGFIKISERTEKLE